MQTFEINLEKERFMGGGIGGSNGSSRGNLSQNIKDLAKSEKLSTNGRFGRRGQGRTQIISVPDPVATAMQYFRKLGNGGTKSKLSNGKGEVVQFADGSRVVYRPKSTSGGPAIDITDVTAGNAYKIHFEQSSDGGTK